MSMTGNRRGRGVAPKEVTIVVNILGQMRKHVQVIASGNVSWRSGHDG